MHSTSGLRYKNGQGFLKRIFSLINSSDETFLILTLSATSLLLAFGLASQFKFAVPFLFLVSLYISRKLKSLPLGFFLITVFSLQFYYPNKYYTVVALDGYQIENILFKEGRTISFGVNLSNIFLVFSMGFMISELIKRKNVRFTPLHPLLPNLLFAVAYLISGIGSALYYSPFFVLSSVWTLQHSQIFLFAILVFYLYKVDRNKFKLIFTVVSFSLILQFIIASLQFLNQSTLGLPIESVIGKQFYYGADEVGSLYRAQGTLLVHNELALIVMIYLAIIVPRAIETKNSLYMASFVAGFATLIMTQSRTNWIGFFFLAILTVRSFSKEIRLLLKIGVFKRGFLYLGLVLSAFSFMIIPRVLQSFNAPFEGAGIPLRKKMISEGIEAFVANPLVGYGAGTNEVVLYSLFPDGIMKDFPYPIHQGHLQFLLEFGIVGAIFFATPFYLTARRIINSSIRKRNFFANHKNLIFSYLVGLVLINLFYSFHNHYGIVEFAFSGLILGLGMIAAYSNA